MEPLRNTVTRAEINANNGKKISLLGKTWSIRLADERTILGIAQHYQVPELIARMIVNRGIDFDQVGDYLNPKIRNALPDPFLLKDMKKAVIRTIEALTNKEKIIIYADYDVDGATASAIIRRYFSDLGYQADVFVPDRFIDGYGPNLSVLKNLHQKGYNLVIFVDSGTAAVDVFKEAKSLSPMDIIVLDHHLGHMTLPEVYALVNPNRYDEDGAYSYLCAAGLAFLFISGIQSLLKKELSDREYPNLLQYLDLVALGTVCDVMPLVKLNRAFVRQGLKIASQRQNVGLKKLADVAQMNEAVSVYHLGFLLGPRINAGGRIGKSYLGSHLLSSKDEIESEKIAQELNQLNLQRQTIEALILQEAIDKVEKYHKDDAVLVVEGQWHQGVIGIVASRLKEKYGRPSCVISLEGPMAKGSGRSISKVDLGRAIQDCVSEGLLTNGGGHQVAVGFALTKDKIDSFRDHLNYQLREQVINQENVFWVDGIIAPSSLNFDFYNKLEYLEPFGQGNSTPKFMIELMSISYWERVGNRHLKCYLMSEFGEKIEAMAFGAIDTPLEDYITNKGRHGLISVVGQIKKDSWNGRQKITFILEDIIPS